MSHSGLQYCMSFGIMSLSALCRIRHYVAFGLMLFGIVSFRVMSFSVMLFGVMLFGLLSYKGNVFELQINPFRVRKKSFKNSRIMFAAKGILEGFFTH